MSWRVQDRNVMESAGQKCHGECRTEMSWRVQDRNVMESAGHKCHGECVTEMSWTLITGTDGGVLRITLFEC